MDNFNLFLTLKYNLHKGQIVHSKLHDKSL
jgi:hypothetical protein